eukprot:1883157-Prymnesium_polylepis.1
MGGGREGGRRAAAGGGRQEGGSGGRRARLRVGLDQVLVSAERAKVQLQCLRVLPLRVAHPAQLPRRARDAARHVVEELALDLEGSLRQAHNARAVKHDAQPSASALVPGPWRWRWRLALALALALVPAVAPVLAPTHIQTPTLPMPVAPLPGATSLPPLAPARRLHLQQRERALIQVDLAQKVAERRADLRREVLEGALLARVVLGEVARDLPHRARSRVCAAPRPQKPFEGRRCHKRARR